MAYATLR